MIKTFKIGESAIGGIIRVEIPKAQKKVWKVSALDWDSAQTVAWAYCYSEQELTDYLESLTTHYYADFITTKLSSIEEKKNHTHHSLTA